VSDGSTIPSLLGRRSHLLVYDSGAFDPHAIHTAPRLDSEDDEATESHSRARTASPGEGATESREMSPTTGPTSDRHERSQNSLGRSGGGSRRTTSASAGNAGTPNTASEAQLFQRLRPESPVFMVPDSAGLDVIKGGLAPLVHSENATCVLWVSLTAEPMLYVDRKPFFLAHRFEHQDAPPQLPRYSDYAAVSRVVVTNEQDRSPEKAPMQRRMSIGRISPTATSLPHRTAAASTTSLPDASNRSIRPGPASSTNAAAEAARRAAEAASSKVPHTPAEVPATAIVNLASMLGVSVLEVEERLRAELLTVVDKAEGVMKFCAHRSLMSADVLVENPQIPGHMLVNDPYRHLNAMRAASTGSSPLAWSSPTSTAVCGARTRECDRFELVKTTIAVPRKEPPPRASIATTRSSMHYSMEQSFAFGGGHTTSPTPRNLGGPSAGASRATSQAGPSAGSRSLRHRPSMASMKSDLSTEGFAANATSPSHAPTQSPGEDAVAGNNRASLALPVPEPLPELDQLPSIIQTPQRAFDDILLNHLPGRPQTTNFVRCPMPRFGGSDWLHRYSRFIRVVFDHLLAGVIGDPNTKPRSVIVTSMASPDDAIFAATAEVVSSLMFERFDPLQKTPHEAAAAQAMDASMDAVFASVRMCAGRATSSLTPNSARKSSRRQKANAADTHDRVFGGLLALDVADPTLMISRAMRALDTILKRAGLYDAVKGRVIRLRQSAEIQRDTPCCRTAVRECCGALERYAYLVYATSLIREKMRGLKPNAEPTCIDLADAVQNTVQGETIERFIAAVDPWATAPHLSPDPYHVAVYTGGTQRWRELYFVERAQ